MRSRRGVALLYLGLVLVAMLVTPAGAHVGTMNHLWAKHMKPLATKLFFTKKQSDSRYYKKADADARYYTKAGSDARYYTTSAADARFELKGETAESGLQAYCSRAGASPRSYPAEACRAPLIVTLDSTGVVGDHTSVAIGVDGLPVVSYRDATNGDLKVLHCGNAACTSGNEINVADPGPVGADTDTSVAIGSDGLPVMSYTDFDDGDLLILHCGNTACSSGNVATPVDTDGWVGEFSSLAIGTDGFPVVSYRDGTNGDLKVLHCGDIACTTDNVTTAVDTTADPLGYDTSIAIGADGLPVASYFDGSTNDLKVVRCGNVACTDGNVSVTLDGPGTVGRHTSIALGADGLPVVSYHDESGGDLELARPPVL